MTNNNNGPAKSRHAVRIGIIAGAALLLAIAGVVGFCKWNAPKVEKNEFYKVKRGDMLISVVEGGALKAVKESVIRSEFEGISRIISIVPEGTDVKQGQILVDLDSS